MAPPKKKNEALETAANLKKNSDGKIDLDVETMQLVLDAHEEISKEEPAIIAGDPDPGDIPVNEIPLDSLKELLGLVRESYSRSNNREFRLRCKRLEASVGEFVAAVDKVKNG